MNIFFIKNMGVIIIIKFKRYMAGACIFGVVIGKFGYYE